MKKILLLIGLFATNYFAFAQISTPEQEQQLLQEYLDKYKREKEEVKQALSVKNLPERVVQTNGEIMEAMYVTPSGHIVYNITYNIGAGRTISTNRVWPGGSFGTSLTGANMANRLGIWDGGGVLLTHQEFGGRAVQTDGAGSLSDHATHVAGTMMAAGVDATARGMAYQASIKAYDWNNDDNEMTQAAIAGMLISNHSYGTISGWYYNNNNSRWEWFGDPSESSTEDYKFGMYDDQARAWDQIARNYPFYLICKAAGNDRGDVRTGSSAWYYSDGTVGTGTAPPADGGASGYDCISTYGNAKNILTVGAVNKIGGNTGNGWTQTSDVVISSFSGYGPTDDGRIKPDVVGPGVNVYSATSTGNTAYETLSGTSMATPAVSGSLLLVQQHFNNLKSRYMRAATLKGLVIHTADEAGSIGPDYRFGWGLMNTQSCVRFINDSSFNKLEERTLTNNQTQAMQFSADAGKPLRITISWTDMPGTPVTSAFTDNPTRMLVNDLDIRLTRQSDGQIFLPYILNPASPATAATTGDNIVDNVEQIHLATPVSGTYTLTISHKGTLSGGSQNFSLLISNAVERPYAFFNTNRTVICAGQTVTFTDASAGGISQRTWYFPGGTPSTSTALNPVVTYPTAGKYPVALKVTGGLGTDSVYRSNLITVGGLDLPFTETFESNSSTVSSWTITNPNSGTITWAPITVAGTTPGNTAMYMNFFDYNNNLQRDQLTSPLITLRSVSAANLTFQHAYTRYGGNTSSDSLVVLVSTNCGVSWTRIAAFGENGTGNWATYQEANYPFGSQNEFTPTAAANWCGGGTGAACRTISLNQFAGLPSLLIRFESVNQYGNNLYLDNISVTGTLIKPVAAFTAKTTVCVGEAVKFNDASDHFPSSWQWTFTGASANSSTEQNPTVSFSAPGQYAVKLKVSNSGGADSITLNNYITVVPAPNAPNIKAASATSLCNGDSVLLSTDSSGNNLWYKDNVLIAGNASSLYAKVSGVYSVRRSNGTCEKGSDITIQVDDKPSTPTITSTVTGTAFCPGGSSTLTSSATANNQWYRNGVMINGANTRSYVVNDSGSYTVITANGVCQSNPSAARSFGLFERPTIGSISGPDEPRRLENIQFSVPNVAGQTYEWSIVNGSILSGNQTSTVTVRFNNIDSGSITVNSRSSVGCRSIPTIKRFMVFPALGLPENNWIEQVQVYPSPASVVATVKINSLRKQQLQIRLINMLGQSVWENQYLNNQGEERIQLPIDNINKGIYFVELENENGKVVKRLVIE
ncbi:MAG: S8 family serine peptidase [Bacteroidia bacterium]|jgi:PKD repeat protein|nr:S8 family serine peptidase [Bacteroidia bacterium]